MTLKNPNKKLKKLRKIKNLIFALLNPFRKYFSGETP